jgi:hypothetical protein
MQLPDAASAIAHEEGQEYFVYHGLEGGNNSG